ncbi:MAG: sigma 54-interacting transcriptional regulator, partial [Bacteroidota bacterium]
VKLLRVLQEGEFERVGNPKTIKVSVRVIAATNRDLVAAIKDNKFRSDLYYRLNIFPVRVPPLRERKADIPHLVRFFASHFGKKIGKSIETISKKTISDLQRYSFPGNVRELENIIERAVITSPANVLQLNDWNLYAATAEKPLSGTLQEVERNYMLQVLENCRWKIEGVNGASQQLGLKPSTLRSRMQKLGIKKPV